MVQRVLSVIGLTVILMGFQNCAETKFSSADGSFSSKGSGLLVPVVSDDSGSSLPTPGGDAQGQLVQGEDPAVPGKKEDSKKEDVADSDSKSDDDSRSDDDSSSDDHDLVACILDGPGKSVKLGLVEESLEGVEAVSKSVCISEKACLEIVPKLFPVKGSEDRGYCGHSPNVIRLTDMEVEALVAAQLKK